MSLLDLLIPAAHAQADLLGQGLQGRERLLDVAGRDAFGIGAVDLTVDEVRRRGEVLGERLDLRPALQGREVELAVADLHDRRVEAGGADGAAGRARVS